jgi:hypothetical protein
VVTVPTSASEQSYAGDGISVEFSTVFYFQASAQVKVWFTPSGGTETALVEGVDYSVIVPTRGSGDPGLVKILGAPPAVGDSLRIVRDVDFTQLTSFRTAGTFARGVQEDALDTIVFQTQELERRVSSLESAGAPGSVVAGDGLSFAGSTLHVGAGAGIFVDADNVNAKFGAAVDMTQAVSDADVMDGGAIDSVARSDHKHTVKTAAPVALVAGGPNTQGNSVSVSRANHIHAAPVGAPVAVDAAAAVTGASGTFSDASHKHQVSVAAPVDIIDGASAAGVANTLARSDHQHSHGARAGGNTHPVAISGGANGFLSGADKAILDALAAARPRVRANQVIAQAIPNAADTVIIFEVEEYDTANGYNPVTGVFTVPAGQGGYYLIQAMLHFAATAFAGASSVASFVRVNGSPVVQGGFSEAPAAGTFRPGLTLTTTLLLNPGDTVAISAYSTGGVARNTFGDNTYAAGVQGSCSLCIDKLN